MRRLIVIFMLLALSSAALAACSRVVIFEIPPQPQPAVPLTELDLGDWQDNAFINEYLGLRLVLHDSWIVMDNEWTAVELADYQPNQLHIAGIFDTDGGTMLRILYEQLPASMAEITESELVRLIAGEVEGVIDVMSTTLPEPIRIGSYMWYSYELEIEIALFGTIEHMRHFVTIRDGVIRHIIINHIEDITPLEEILGMFSGV